MPALCFNWDKRTTVSTCVETTEPLSFLPHRFVETCPVPHRFAGTYQQLPPLLCISKLEFISISILLFSSIGMISAARMHPQLDLLFPRDYFARPDASLSGSFVPQGLFRPPGCISIWLFCSTGIISPARMHLYRTLLLHRDYFTPVRCISIGLFCSTGIISPG